MNFLGNFDIKEYRKVIDATVVKSDSFDKICIDLRMRLQVLVHKQALDEHDNSQLGEEPSVPQKRSKEPLDFHSLNEVTIMRN